MMLNSVLRRSCSRLPRPLTRHFAEIVPATPSRASASSPLTGTIDPPPPSAIASPHADQSTETSETKIVRPVRLGQRVPVREDHGLYGFFRKRQQGENGKIYEGEAQYETLGGSKVSQVDSGRSWKASELRLKSFEDLHTLWYILLRERNVLATQKEEVRRLGAIRMVQNFGPRVRMVRKSMARIKYVLNERRLAYDGASKLAEEEKTAHTADIVLRHQLAEHKKERTALLVRQRRARVKAARAAKKITLAGSGAEAVEALEAQTIVNEAVEGMETVAEPKAPADAPTTQQQAASKESNLAVKPARRVKTTESASEAASARLFGTQGRRR